MAMLLEEIRKVYPCEARDLERADFRSDDEIQSLTRGDLNELFPGVYKIKKRKAIYELIHKQKPVDVLLSKLKAVIPESVKAALTGNGVLNDYLCTLKDLKTKVENVLTFLDAHVCLLEGHINGDESEKGVLPGMLSNQDSQGSGCDKGPIFPSSEFNSHKAPARHELSTPASQDQRSNHGACPSDEGSAGWLNPWSWISPSETKGGDKSDTRIIPDSSENIQGDDFHRAPANVRRPHLSDSDPGQSTRAQSEPLQRVLSSVVTQQKELPTVRFQCVIGSRMFSSEKILLDRVRSEGRLMLVETNSSHNCHIIIVFCPITTRIESDVESVMKKVAASSSGKPVILVLMHHTRNVDYRLPRNTWLQEKWNIILDVNVLYHETVPGLLNCTMNTEAVTKMDTTLLEHAVCDSSNGRDADAGSIEFDARSHERSTSEGSSITGGGHVGGSGSGSFRVSNAYHGGYLGESALGNDNKSSGQKRGGSDSVSSKKWWKI